jgi:hypothetical protein
MIGLLVSRIAVDPVGEGSIGRARALVDYVAGKAALDACSRVLVEDAGIRMRPMPAQQEIAAWPAGDPRIKVTDPCPFSQT